MPDYAHDIFLSYAHCTDASQWVTAFRNALRCVLEEKPVIGDIDIFMDVKSIEGGEKFDKRIEKSLATSAVMIIILSEASLDPLRYWCKKERDDFIRYAGGANAVEGRIFLVNYDGIKPGDLPDEINRYTPYRFFERNPRTDTIMPAAIHQARAGRFHDELYDLRDDLIKALVRLGAPSVKGKQKPADESQPIVFLAEVIPGQLEQDEYSQVKSAISQYAQVVPGRRSFYAAWEGFEDEIDGHLQKADLFVQLLGKQRWPQSPKFEMGYERWLFERAKSREKPILRWQSRNLDLSDIEDDKYYHELLLFPDDLFGVPRVCDLPEFIPMIYDALNKIKTREKLLAGRGGCRVLVVAHKEDKPLCDSVGEELEYFGPCQDNRMIEAELVFTNGVSEVVNTATAISPRGLVVVWRDGPQDELFKIMRTCRQYKRKVSALTPPLCAVVVPSLESHPVNRRPPGFEVIPADNRNQLELFVKRICGEVH